MSDDIQYPDHFIERLHTIWGEGFLSPGGAEEVWEIVNGIDLSGKVVLDVGFGTGGPAIALAKDHHGAKVVGIDWSCYSRWLTANPSLEVSNPKLKTPFKGPLWFGYCRW